MEPPQSGQLSTVFSDDYKYFESNHIFHPIHAATVFECVAGLRVALQAFRDAANKANITIERVESATCADRLSNASSIDVADLRLEEHISDVGAPALLASVDGSSEI